MFAIINQSIIKLDDQPIRLISVLTGITGWSYNVFVKYDPETSHFVNKIKHQA